MKPQDHQNPGMNPAAAVVIGILGLVASVCTFTICAIALRTNDGKDPKEIAVFCLGAISGVLAKTGYDLIRNSVGPVRGDVNMGDDGQPKTQPKTPTDPTTVPPPVEGQETPNDEEATQSKA